MQPFKVAGATWQCYSLPLQKPLTSQVGSESREGLIWQVMLQQGEQVYWGAGEVAPLPGNALHTMQTNFCQTLSSFSSCLQRLMNRFTSNFWFVARFLRYKTHLAQLYMDM